MKRWVTARSLLFISHTGSDKDSAEKLSQLLDAKGYDFYLDFDPEHGTAGGRNWERDIYRQLRRADGLILLVSSAYMASKWCFAERAIARLLSKPIIPLRLAGAPPPDELQQISDIQAIDFSAADPYPQLFRALRENHFIPGDPLKWDKERPPYPGLQAFGSEDAAVFFGRDRQIEELWENFTRPLGSESSQAVTIVGPSGSGKSSLLRAGLLPRLDGPNWIVLEPFVPGFDPTAKLAQSFANFFKSAHLKRSEVNLTKQLATTSGLATIVGEMVATRSRLQNVVIAVDQAEELITRTPASERQGFLRMLERAQAMDDRLWVVSTLRQDFLSEAPDLVGLCDRGQTVVIQPPNKRMLLDVIREPAKRAGIDFPEDLARQMVEDTAGGDALPLLAYTLEKVYQHYRDRNPDNCQIAWSDYEAAGTVSGAITHQADGITAYLTDLGYGERVLPTLQRLADVRETGEIIRRRVNIGDLASDEQMIIEEFTKARLLKKDDDAVEAAHEALLRQWPPLSEWIDRESRSLRIRSELSRWAAEWDQNGRDEEDDGSYLQHGGRLDDWLIWAKEHKKEVDPVQQEFLDASENFRDRRFNAMQKALEEAQANRALAEQRRKRAVRVALGTVGVALLAVIALVGAIVFHHAANVALRQAAAGRLVAEAETMLAGTRTDGDFRMVQQLLAAQLVSPDVNDASGLLDAVIQRQDLVKLVQTRAAVSGTAVSADRTRIAAAEKGADGTVEIWDSDSLTPIGHPIKPGHGRVYVVGFAGQNVVAGSDDGSLGIWDPATGQPIAASSSSRTAPRPGLRSLVITSDQRLIVAGDDEGEVRVFNASTAEPDGLPIPVCAKSIEVWSVAVTGQTLAAGCEDGTVSRWNLTGAREPIGAPLNPGLGPIWAVALSPRGNRMAAAGQGDSVVAWDGPDDLPTAGRVPGGVFSVAFSSDGDRLATGGVDNKVRVWDVQQSGTMKLTNVLIGHQGDVQSVAFVGDRLLSGGDDETVRIWKTVPLNHENSSPAQPSDVCEQTTRCVENLTFRDQTLVSVTGDGTRRLWNADGAPLGQPLRPVVSATPAVASSDDGLHLAVTGPEPGSVRVWDSLSLKPASQTITAARGEVEALAISGPRIALFNHSVKAVQEYNIDGDKQQTSPMRTGEAAVNALTYSSDGTRLAAAGNDGNIRVWNSSTGQAITTMGGDDDVNRSERSIASVAFSRDGQRLVSGARGDDTVRLWDVGKGKQIAKFGQHEKDVTTVAFSRSGRFVLSGAKDGTVRLWDTIEGEPVGQALQTGGLIVTSVAFGPDDRSIVAGLADGSVRVWPGPAVWRQDLCGKLVHNMNRKDWENWVKSGIGFQEVCPHLPQRTETDAPA